MSAANDTLHHGITVDILQALSSKCRLVQPWMKAPFVLGCVVGPRHYAFVPRAGGFWQWGGIGGVSR